LITSAAASAAQTVPMVGEATPMVGNDRDAHGCIGSAGYSWCGRTQKCERPWELAKRKSFRNSARAFKRFCGGK